MSPFLSPFSVLQWPGGVTGRPAGPSLSHGPPMSSATPPSAAPPDPPKSPGERALTAVPVVLTVLATVLAGLSSGEMTRSMYYRSLAAQNQAKAGSQWAFFQAKRTRGTVLEATAELARGLAEAPPPEEARCRTALDRVATAVARIGGAHRQ